MLKRQIALATLLIIILMPSITQAQQDSLSLQNIVPEKWNDKIKISGYMQFRNNDLYKTNPAMENQQGDKTYGGREGFSIRRMRVKVSGWVHPMVYYYFQADFASDGKNLGQLRDAYADLYLDKQKEFRFRIGQSKVPFGFVNLQSSQNRLPLDRNDAINSGLKDERDFMVVGYYTPKRVQEIFNYLKKNRLKHSGDYGMAGLGIYNGQLANKIIYNDYNNYHVVGRFTYPIRFANGQIIEPGVQAYSGDYITHNVSEGMLVKDKFETSQDGKTVGVSALDYKFKDQRAGATFVLYPQPFGIQAEYNIGRGPEYDKEANAIDTKSLQGGYVTLSYKANLKEHVLFPFVQYFKYEGGKKFELDARSYNVEELNIGVEWQPNRAFELAAILTAASRRFEDSLKPNNFEKGQLVRLQAQINF